MGCPMVTFNMLYGTPIPHTESLYERAPMANRLIRGTTGSGKTNYLVVEHLAYIDRNDGWLIAQFPHPQAGELFVAELFACFGESILDRLVVERYSDMDRVIMRTFVRSSTHPDFLTRMQENEELLGSLMDKLAQRRKINDLAEFPVLEKYSRLAIRVKQNQSEWFPDYKIPKILVPNGPIWRQALEHCTDCELAAELDDLQTMPIREQLSLLEPARRLLEGIFRSPPIIARTSQPEEWDKETRLNNNMIYVGIGGNISDDALRIMVGSDYQDTIFLAKQRRIKPGRYSVDEVNNYHLCGPFEARSLSTSRAFGVETWYADQVSIFPTPEIEKQVDGNSDHVWFLQGDEELAEKAAKDLSGGFDEFKIHHTDETHKQVHLGFDYEERHTKGRVKDHLGGIKSESESTSIVPIARYGEVIEQRHGYQSGQEQTFWKKTDLLSLPVGSCFVRQRGRAPYRENVKLMPDSWAFPGLAKQKFHECLELIKRKPIFQKPILHEEPKNKPSTNGFKARERGKNGTKRF
jgi:hypothetical protein